MKILLVIAMVVVCGACARSSESDLWKVVKYTQEQRR